MKEYDIKVRTKDKRLKARVTIEDKDTIEDTIQDALDTIGNVLREDGVGYYDRSRYQ